MLLTLLMNLNMFGPPPVPPDRIIIDLPSSIETGLILRSVIDDSVAVSSTVTTGQVMRSRIKTTEIIDSPITTSA